MSAQGFYVDTSDPDGLPRHIGILTTDPELVITSWDGALASMTGIATVAAVGRPLATVVPDLASRGLLAIVKDTLDTGAPKMLAPAFHKYFISAPPLAPSPRYDRMQQRVAIARLVEQARVVGLVVTIEDVTGRLDLEHQLAGELRGSDPAARLRAIERLSALNPVEGLGPLPSALGDEDWHVRQSAVEVLASRRDPMLVDALVSALREGHRDFSVLSSALQLVTMTGADLTSSLIDLLHSPDSDLRMQSALALGTQTRPEAVDALLGALDDEDVNVRFHAIESLGKLGPPAGVERLAAIAESHDFFLAFPALDALSRIDDPTVAPRLVPLLNDELVGDQAAEALGQIGDEDAIAPLTAALDSPHLSPSSLVAALAAIHRRRSEMFHGGATEIEELVRQAISPRGARRVIDAAAGTNGPALRSFVTVLGWLRGADVERALTHMLGTAGAQKEIIEAVVRFGTPMVDRLIDQLNGADLETRRAAIVALGRIGDRRAVPSLVRLLDDDDRSLLIPTATALARLGGGQAFEPLVRLLGDHDIAVRQGAIAALNSIGHPEMSGRVRALLEDANPRVRESAVKIAGYFGYASCADLLIARCVDADETVRAAALAHVVYLDDPRGLPLLTGALERETPRARAAAAQALSHVESPEALTALRRAVHDPDSWVRYFSLVSLGRQADKTSLPLFELVAAEDAAPHVRIAAVAAIGAVGATSDEAVPMLASLAEASDDELAMAAIRALASVEASPALEPLRRALSAPQASRRVAAAETLARRGGKPAVELLQWAAAAAGDPTVIRAAIGGLSRIGESQSPEAPAAVAAIASIAADAARRPDAIAALARASEAAIPRVGNCLSSREPVVRRAVVEALGRLAHPTASTYLMTALHDSDATVRQLAVTVLSRLGTRGVARSFADIVRTDPSESVRRSASVALTRMRKGRADAALPLEER